MLRSGRCAGPAGEHGAPHLSPPFQKVTGLSPLQCHRRLRLYEAQRLMPAENPGASGAALALGYESPAQFNREYKRLFGEPPHRDMNNRRLPLH